MTERANHSIVVGEGADAKTIAAGEPLPAGVPADELVRLRKLGAIGVQPAVSAVAAAAEPIAEVGQKVGRGKA